MWGCESMKRHCTCWSDSNDLIRIFVCSVWGLDVDGKVPLVEALIARDTAIATLLSENGATLKNADMGACLGQAVLDGNKDLIDDFIKYGADINRYHSLCKYQSIIILEL